MKKVVNIYDVADAAGVSIATVSRVINSPGKVSPRTRDLVLKIIRELDFTPKAEAVARARADFKRVGVIVPFFTAPSFTQRLRGIMHTLNQHEYELITYVVDNYEQLQSYLTTLPFNRRIDGLIILALPFSDEDVSNFLSAQIPMVSIEYAHEGIPHVVIDNFEGGRLAAKHLASKGRKKFAFIGEGGEPPYSLHATDERLAGYRAWLSENGLSLTEDCIARHSHGMDDALKSATVLLDCNGRPDAVFAASDLQAVAVMKAAAKKNLHIPRDISLIGFDDIDLADYMGITTINQSLDESGSTAVRLLIDQMENGVHVPSKVVFPLRVVERATS
ncbi:MAG: LacI family DNA-binding transcriptional regulator [Spirochaetales bacterium]|nr:LacI family DNA-binding transcriptional regulator [Spirochaetales bacterium]